MDFQAHTLVSGSKDLNMLENDVGVLIAVGTGELSELRRWNSVLSLDASSSFSTGVPSADRLTPEVDRRKQLEYRATN